MKQLKRSISVFYATVAVILSVTTAACGAAPKTDAAFSFSSMEPNSLKAVSGKWYTEGREGGVELYPCGDHVCGRFYWLRDDMQNGDISRDTQNPDPLQREHALCQMQFMGSFKPDGHGKYTGGWIYNPRDGGTYSAQMTLIDHETLDLHGYLFFPFLGESQIWKRAKDMPTCKSE